MRSALEFLGQLQDYYGGKPKSDFNQRTTVQELEKYFASDQWELLFRSVVTKHDKSFMPMLGQILQIARECNISKPEPPKAVFSDEWPKTDCKLCGGEGILQVIFCHEYERGERNTRTRRFVTLGAYSSVDWLGYVFEDGYVSYVFRCACDAGDDKRHPKSWKKWSTDMRGTHIQRQNKDEGDKPAKFGFQKAPTDFHPGYRDYRETP